MKIIGSIQKIKAKIKNVWNNFIQGFILGVIISFFIGIWFIFTIYNVIFLAPEKIPISDYLTISLTLFGFTLVGGIFEKNLMNQCL